MNYIRENGVHSKKIGQTWYILENNHKTMRELNDVAGHLWQLLAKKQSMESLVKSVCSQYRVAPERARKDIQAFSDDYIKDKYLTVVQ